MSWLNLFFIFKICTYLFFLFDTVYLQISDDSQIIGLYCGPDVPILNASSSDFIMIVIEGLYKQNNKIGFSAVYVINGKPFYISQSRRK